MEEQLHCKLFSMRSSHARTAWADPPIVCRESLKEASRCMIQVAGYVAFNNPLVDAPIAGEPIPNVGDGVIGASIWPESIGMDTKVSFPYGFQDHTKGFLHNPVVNGSDTERSLFH